MKKVRNKWIMMIAATFFVSMLNVTVSMAHDGGVSLQVFYDELQPYGTWIAYENYGYVWRPRVDRDFVPYATNGYWINTEYGNTWVSDYGWGWAPFHYGRWFYDDFYGWMWAPDTVWGPAWVAWRSGGGYYGWAPLMPGITVSVSYNYYDRIPDRYWSFVPCRYITYRTVYRHCVPRPQVVTIIHQTTVVTHHYTDNRRRTYFTGPSRREIERVNNTRVPVYAVNDRSRPGRTEIERDRASFYKPEIDNDRESRAQAMPSRMERRDRRSTTDLRNGLDDNSANRQSVDDRRREVRDEPIRRSETNREGDARIDERTRETENVRRGQEQERSQSRERQQQDQKPLDKNDLRQSSDKQNREREDGRRQQEARERLDRDNDNRRMQEERVRDQQRQQDQQRVRDQQQRQEQQQERTQERQRQQEQQRQQQQQQRMQDQQRQQEQRQQEQQRQRVQEQQHRQQEQRVQQQQQRQEQQQMRQQRMTQPERQAPSRTESPREQRGNGSRRRD